VNLLVILTAADSSYGKAYGLGRALADTTCPHQTPDQLAKSFESHRISQLCVWLDELASLLPDHAARAVEQSLHRWQQAVAAPADGPTTAPRPIESLAAALARQGALWRGVLAGDKLCTDLLTPQDYLRAGDRLARHYADLVGRVLRTMPWLLLLLLLLVAIVLLLVFIPGSAVARTATGVAAIAGTFSGIWKVIRTRVTPIAAQLERPLWGNELNTAAAEAITVPPVGTPQDPARETAYEQVAAEVITAATQAQPIPSTDS
jgi:hypothetical protein